jgi:hypothetical protein
MEEAQKKVGGDQIVATVSNVSGGQIAVGKSIQQTRIDLPSQGQFKKDEFLLELRNLKGLIASLDIDDDLKEDIEDNISNMRQDVKKSVEEDREPDKGKINHYLKTTNDIVENISKVGNIGTKIFPALQTLARLAGLPL